MAVLLVGLATSMVATSTAAALGPCDILAAANEGTPCVAAHSTVRALYGGYTGPLYQVKRIKDGAVLDIYPLTAGGIANSTSQDAFCNGDHCVIFRIFDQSPNENHLDVGPKGGNGAADSPTNATRDKIFLKSYPVYGVYFEGGMGYRNDNAKKTATGDQPETIYAVFDGQHYNGGCCFDYGNAETNNDDDGAGTMEALYFGSAKGGLNHGGAGKGPWIMADMENALWGADVVESNEPPINHTFVTAMIKGDVSRKIEKLGPYTENLDFVGNDIAPCGFNGCVLPATATHLDCLAKCNMTAACAGYIFANASCSGKAGPICWTKGAMVHGHSASCRDSQSVGDIPGHWAIKGGDAQNGDLKVFWDGKRAPGYAPMKKQGAIILGIGGDNSHGAIGTFYEGVMASGYTSDATDAAIQANIVGAGYSRR